MDTGHRPDWVRPNAQIPVPRHPSVGRRGNWGSADSWLHTPIIAEFHHGYGDLMGLSPYPQRL